MGNKITIEIDVDPNGRGASAIRGINSDLDKLGGRGASNFRRAAGGGRDLASSLDEIKSAIAVGAVVEFGRESVLAFARAGDGARVLKASAREAGQEFDSLNKKALEFGKLIGQSETEAQRSFASIVQFAKQAGRGDQLDGFTQSLVDRLAAKGVSSDKIPDLLSQLKTGQDEVFDRLFGANPSKYYDEYAKSIGKTAESLTDLEKAQVRFDTILKGGAIFSGEAKKRADDLSGGIDQLGANFENLKKNLGQAIQGPANSIVGILNAAATGKDNALVNRLFDSLGLTDTSSSKGIALINAEGEKQAAEIVKTLRDQEKKIAEALQNPNGNLQNLALSLAAPQISPFDTDPAKRDEIIQNAVSQATKMRDDFKKLLLETAKDEKSSVSLLRLAIKELDERGGILGGDQGKIRRELEKAIENQVKPALEKIKQIGKESKSLLDDISLQAKGDNPFVKLFTDAERAAEKLRETTRGLSKETVEMYARIQQQAVLKQLFGVRVDTALSALDLRNQAKDFRSFVAPKNSVDSRRNPFSDEQLLQIARNDPNRYREFFNENGFVDDEAKKNFQIRFSTAALLNSNLGDKSTGALATIFARGLDAEETVDPNKRTVDRLREQLSTIDKLRAANKDLTNDDLAGITDKRIISLTSSLRPEDLTGDLRERAAQAREREAVRLEKQEQEAAKQRNENNELLKQVNKNLEDLKKIANEEGLRGLDGSLDIAIKSKDFEIESLTRTPTANDTADTYNFGGFALSGGSNR